MRLTRPVAAVAAALTVVTLAAGCSTSKPGNTALSATSSSTPRPTASNPESTEPGPAARAETSITGNGGSWVLDGDDCPAPDVIAEASGWSNLTENASSTGGIGHPWIIDQDNDPSDPAYIAPLCAYSAGGVLPTVYLEVGGGLVPDPSATPEPALGQGAQAWSHTIKANGCELDVPVASTTGYSGNLDLESITDTGQAKPDCNRLVTVLKAVATQSATLTSNVPTALTADQALAKAQIECENAVPDNSLPGVEQMTPQERIQLWSDANERDCDAVASEVTEVG
jgi:hypothetical protein